MSPLFQEVTRQTHLPSQSVSNRHGAGAALPTAAMRQSGTKRCATPPCASRLPIRFCRCAKLMQCKTVRNRAAYAVLPYNEHVQKGREQPYATKRRRSAVSGFHVADRLGSCAHGAGAYDCAHGPYRFRLWKLFEHRPGNLHRRKQHPCHASAFRLHVRSRQNAHQA